MRSLTLLVIALPFLGGGCAGDSPLAPAEPAGPPPRFLIGNSPLAPAFEPAIDPGAGIVVGGAIRLGVEVNKGLTKVGDADRFVLRSGIAFVDESGRHLASTGARDDPVANADLKDQGLRQGSTVPFDIGTVLLPDVWLPLLLNAGSVDADANIGLVLRTASGDRLLEEVAFRGPIDPTGGAPVMGGAASPVIEAAEDAAGSVSRSLIAELYIPQVLAGALAAGDVEYRASAEFSLDGSPVALAGYAPSTVVDVSSVNDDVALVVIATPIDDAVWALVDAAVSKPGDLVSLNGCIQLVLPDTGGGEVTVLSLELTGTTDPKVDGVPPAKQDDTGAGK